MSLKVMTLTVSLAGIVKVMARYLPDGAILFKELHLTLPAQNPDGSRAQH
jgi:hypothetical protein